MKKIKIKQIAIGVLIISIFFACLSWLFYWWSEKKRLQTELTENIPHVKVEAIGFDYIYPNVRAELFLKPQKLNDLVAGLNTQVLEVYIEDGQNVVKGQKIALLDTDELEREISKANEKLIAAQSELENANTEVSRNEMLVSVNAVPKKLLDEAKNKQKQAQSNVAIVILDKESLQNKMQKKYVLATMNGKISKVYAQVGMSVRPGTVMASIGDSMALEGKAAIAENYKDDFSVGDAVDVIFENNHAFVYPGKVKKVEDKAQNNSAKPVELTIDFLNKDGDMHYYYATVQNVMLRKQTRNTVLSVPKDALLFEERKVFVYVLRPDNTAVRRQIEVANIAGNDASYLEVVDGISEGEFVVVSNLDKLSNAIEKVIVD